MHFVCRVEIDIASVPGDGVAGIDLGISGLATVSYGDKTVLYPGGALKEDEYYFAKKRAETDDSTSRERSVSPENAPPDGRTVEDIVAECVERGVGMIVVGDLGGIREDENGEARNWGDHGNLDLHGWAFGRFTTMLSYKVASEGIDVVEKSERGTSKTCSACGQSDKRQRVERGLYVRDCGFVGNADCNGAANIRRRVLPNRACDGGDRDTGWLASRSASGTSMTHRKRFAFSRQPAVRLFDPSEGRFAPREQVVDREP
nr:zinc ribbon domain-containing protein [Halegenticoccus soli]